MVFAFLLGALASWAAPKAQEQVKSLLLQAFPNAEIPESELRVISTLSLMFAAAVVAWMLGSGGQSVALTLGAVIGVLGQRIYGRINAMRAPDYDS